MSKPSQICIFTEAKKVFYVVSVSPSQWLAFVGQAKVDIYRRVNKKMWTQNMKMSISSLKAKLQYKRSNGNA